MKSILSVVKYGSLYKLGALGCFVGEMLGSCGLLSISNILVRYHLILMGLSRDILDF